MAILMAWSARMVIAPYPLVKRTTQWTFKESKSALTKLVLGDVVISTLLSLKCTSPSESASPRRNQRRSSRGADNIQSIFTLSCEVLSCHFSPRQAVWNHEKIGSRCDAQQ